MKWIAALVLLIAVYAGSMPLFFAAATFLFLEAGSRIWIRQASAGVRVRRLLGDSRLFFGEATTVTIRIENVSRLPLPWLHIQEQVPLALSPPPIALSGAVVRLDPHGCDEVTYTVVGVSRGFHELGPLRLTAGDVLGRARRELRVPERQQLIVYPRLLSSSELHLPSLSPYGDLPSRRSLVGDPARLAGVRDYRAGDPFHAIHWRATAAVGTLQVKQLQPTTTLHTMIVLDSARSSFGPGSYGVQELSISVAATVASRLLAARQSVGLETNGNVQPLASDRSIYPSLDSRVATRGTPTALEEIAPSDRVQLPAIAPAKGPSQVLRIMESLARLELSEDALPLTSLLIRHGVTLPWGSTLIVIAAMAGDDLFLALHRQREAGLQVVLYLVGRQRDQQFLSIRARTLGIHLHVVTAQQEVVPL